MNTIKILKNSLNLTKDMEEGLQDGQKEDEEIKEGATSSCLGIHGRNSSSRPPLHACHHVSPLWCKGGREMGRGPAWPPTAGLRPQ
jgi:hypothetical protein